MRISAPAKMRRQWPRTPVYGVMAAWLCRALAVSALLVPLLLTGMAQAQVVPPPNTPIGPNVAVSPTDATRNFYVSPYQPVTLTFANVTFPGDTQVRTRYDLTPPPPKDPQTNLDLQTGSPASYFDLS